MRIQFYHAGSSITVQYCYVLYAALTGINEASDRTIHANVYPNPVKDYLHIESERELNRIEVTDISGRVISSLQVASDKAVIPVYNLDKGIYFVHYTDLSGNHGMAKITR